MFDSLLPESKDHLPLTWWKTHPIYLAAYVALVAPACMIIYAVLGTGVMETWLAFSFEAAFRQWHLWTPLTYVLVNPPSFWVLISAVILWNFGEPVERHLGRRSFVKLLLLLMFSAPVLATLLHLVGSREIVCAGLMQLDFGVFIAFASLYPKAKISLIIATVDAWVLAAIYVGVGALARIADRDWFMLLHLAAEVAIAYTFIRYEQGELKLPSLPKPRSKHTSSQPSRSSASTGAGAKPVRSAKPKGPSVDDILDKISHQGMQSLTPEERRILDQASEEMKKRAR